MTMSKDTKAPKGAIQAAAGQLKKIAKRNEATPKGPMAGATTKLIKAMQAKR